MNPIEATEILALPPKYRPLSAWAYLGYSILFAIPLFGYICLIVFSFSNSNINRRNFARSYFCVLLLTVIIIAVCGFVYTPAVFTEIQSA